MSVLIRLKIELNLTFKNTNANGCQSYKTKNTSRVLHLRIEQTCSSNYVLSCSYIKGTKSLPNEVELDYGHPSFSFIVAVIHSRKRPHVTVPRAPLGQRLRKKGDNPLDSIYTCIVREPVV